MDTERKTDQLEAMCSLGADWWNDSCDLSQLSAAVSKGATGATSNPVIVEAAVSAEKATWLPVIAKLSRDHPQESNEEIAWRLIADIGRQAAEILLPVYEETDGAKGYLSLQVNPKHHSDPEKMFQQAVALAGIARNVAIKLPTTECGLATAERLVANGIPVNTTISFSVAQALAAAEAIERGLEQFEQNGGDPTRVHPYVTIMVGRVTDYLNRIASREGIDTLPENATILAGAYVFKEAARHFKSRGYRSTLLAAAYRHELHWSQIVGPGVLQSIPYSWWTAFNQSDFAVRDTLSEPEDPAILEQLQQRFPDFSKVYRSDGLSSDAFQNFEATTHTLNQFIEGYDKLLFLIEDTRKQA